MRGLIYPVPDPDLPFLGVHLTKHVSGEVWLGPTALLVGARDAYRLRTRARRATSPTRARWPGTWRVMRRWWRTGLTELRMATAARAFVAACRAYVPDLAVADLARESTARRARAGRRPRRPARRRLPASARPAACSTCATRRRPAATSSLALASLIADRAEAVLAASA